jgi:hypothetical protein
MNKKIILGISAIIIVLLLIGGGLIGYFVWNQTQINNSLEANKAILNEVGELANQATINPDATEINSEDIQKFDNFLTKVPQLSEKVDYGPNQDTKEVGDLTKNMIDTSVPFMQGGKELLEFGLCYQIHTKTLENITLESVSTETELLFFYNVVVDSYKNLGLCVDGIGDFDFDNKYISELQALNQELQAGFSEQKSNEIIKKTEELDTYFTSLQTKKEEQISANQKFFEEATNKLVQKAEFLSEK